MNRSARVTAVRPEWGVGLLPRRLIWPAIALLVVAAFRPGPLSAAALGLTLLVLALLLAEPVPREIDIAVSTRGRRVMAGEVVRMDLAVDFGSEPSPMRNAQNSRVLGRLDV